jgi:hypothetical protein
MHNDTPKTHELSQSIQDVKDIINQLSRITDSIRKADTNALIHKANTSYDPDHPRIAGRSVDTESGALKLTMFSE